MLSGLEKSIIATLVYFDIFDYPLTALEVFKWLLRQGDGQIENSFYQVKSALDKDSLKKIINQKNGFYFLKHRERIVDQRLENYKVAERKFKKAIRFIKLLRFNPLIKMVAICNSLAFSNAGDYSDIDFFIIAKKKRIWLARFWANFLPKIFGLRPTRSDTQDKLCLTFFIAEDKLNIADLQCSQFDIYLAYWISQVLPIYDPDQLYPQFIKANNWIEKYFPNFLPYQVNNRRKVKDSIISKSFRRLGGLIYWRVWGNWQESLVKNIQLAALPATLKKVANQDTKVVINDQVLKFHDNDRRAKFKKMFEEKMSKLVN